MKKINTDSILQLKDKAEDCFRQILKIHRDLPSESVELTDALLELHTSNKLDLLDISTAAVKEGLNVFQVSHIISPIIPRISNIDCDRLFIMLEEFSSKMKGDMASGIFHPAIEDLVKAHPEIANKLENLILSSSNELIYSYVISIYLGLFKTDPENAYKKVISLCQNEIDTLAYFGIKALGNLVDFISQSNEKKKAVYDLIKEQNKSKNVKLQSASTFTTMQFSKTSEPEILKEAILLSKSKVPEVQYELLNHLKLKEKNILPWQKELFENIIVDYSLEFDGISKSFDLIFYNILNQNNFDIFKSIIFLWVNNRSISETNKFRFDELFPMATSQIFRKEFPINTLLTELFNNDSFCAHNVASDIVGYMKLHNIKPNYLDVEYIEKLDYQDTLFMIRKILGFTIDFDYTIKYILSFLILRVENKDKFDLVATVLIEHIGNNYIYKTIKYLKNEEQSNAYEKLAKDYINHIIQVLEERFDKRKSLKNINELQPELDAMIKIEKSKQRQFSKAMEKAQKNSLTSLFTNVGIKEGKKWFSFIHGEYSTVSSMGHFETGYELPKSDVLDSIGATLERQGFRLAKRGQQ